MLNIKSYWNEFRTIPELKQLAHADRLDILKLRISHLFLNWITVVVLEVTARLPYRYCSKNVSGYRRHPRSIVAYSVEVALTGKFADKPTCGQSSHGLDNSRTGQLADNDFLKKHGITILSLYIKPNPNPNSNPIEYWQRINRVICPT